MNLQRITWFLLGAAAVLTVSCSSSSTTATNAELALVQADQPGAEARSGSLESEVVDRINRYRASKGKGPLRRHAGLEKLARIHSQEMFRTQKMSHKQFHHRDFAAKEQLKLENLCENVVSGRGIPKSELGSWMVQAWVDSSGHRINLLAGNQDIGVAVVQGADGSFYATQLSARPSNEYEVQAGGPMDLW